MIRSTDRYSGIQTGRYIDRRIDKEKDSLSHLSMLQWVQSGVVRRTDDLSVTLVGRRSESWCDVVTSQTLRVTDGVKLPGVKGHTIQRALQDPVT